MKYELPCEVVKDLLPLYVDELTSENVAESVEEHILTCSDCRREYDGMKNTNDIQIQAKADKSLMKKAKKRFSKKLTLVGLIVALVASVATLTGAAVVYKNGDIIKSDDITATVTEIDFDSIDFNEDSREYTYDGRQYEMSEEEYARAKENGIIQKIHLNTNYVSEAMCQNEIEINGEFICFVSVESNGEIADKSKESRNGWNWMQIAKPYDKIIYINNESELLSKVPANYKIIWEKQKSTSINELMKEYNRIKAENYEMGIPKLLWKSDKLYGEDDIRFTIQYWKDYDYETNEMNYALFMKAENEGISDLAFNGHFVDYKRFTNDKLMYDYDNEECDSNYFINTTKKSCYYSSIVPSDCDYAEIEGQKLYSQKTNINIDGIDYDVTYICGVVDNISGSRNNEDRVTLFDNKGNAHTDERTEIKPNG